MINVILFISMVAALLVPAAFSSGNPNDLSNYVGNPISLLITLFSALCGVATGLLVYTVAKRTQKTDEYSGMVRDALQLKDNYKADYDELRTKNEANYEDLSRKIAKLTVDLQKANVEIKRLRAQVTVLEYEKALHWQTVLGPTPGPRTNTNGTSASNQEPTP